ncbi:MAG TPA: ketopantoate reductase family protein [Terriglobales bacterium]|jgi:2-dehydropantoate 2-reductase|nr:ketopantoate reductase family protein [Terriglobales bacterium]
MEHAVLGAGAIGGLVGAAVASLGEGVTVLVRPERLPGYPANLSVERPSGAIEASVKVAATLPNPVDVLWIATKTYQLKTALQAVQSSPRCIVPLLNGVDHVEVLRAHFGRDRVVPATIAVEAEKIGPGRFVQRSPFVNLNLAASGEQVLGAIVARLRDLEFTCRFIQNEQTLLWSKLCFLGPFALVTSASGMNKGEIYADAEWKRKLISAMTEACAVSKASRAEVDAAQIQAIYDGLPSGIRSSMQKDLASGRQLELDAIGGPIVRDGEHYGIDVSTTEALIAVIRAKITE